MKTIHRLTLLSLAVGLFSAAGAALSPRMSAQARPGSPPATTDPCAAPANKTVAENCRPGNPREEWDIFSAGDTHNIQGFATDISVNLGETVELKIRTDSPKYRIDIYRMGWYGGNGARLVQTVRPSVPLPQMQPECRMHAATRLVDCGNWKVSASWRVPADAASGVYVARLVREDDEEPEHWRSEGNYAAPAERPPAVPHAYGSLGLGKLRDVLKEKRASHIVFVVRDDASQSDILFQTSDPTWVAFNRYGVSSLYGSFPPGGGGGGGGGANIANIRTRAHRVSYNRPIMNRVGVVQEQLFNAEFPMLRWLERNGYDVSYFAGVDSDRRGEKIRQHKIFLSVGHDAYWSAAQRKNVEAARNAGVNLAFMSGNVAFWKTRYEPSIDGTNTPYRTLICYKETHADGKLDPEKDQWTGTWRDSRPFNPDGPKPENALTGTIATVGGFRNDRLFVPANYGKLRFWRNTEAASVSNGQTAVFGKGVLGHVWDQDLDNGARPNGLIRLSETTVDNVTYVQDFGTVYDSATATHHMTLYRAPSGALVFSAGSVQYSWGLDALHNNWVGTDRLRPEPAGPVKAMQQATVNLFADMGVQPSNLQPDLSSAQPSQDKTGPLSRIQYPTNGTRVDGVVTVRGTATDAGGVVAGVEVSVDGGATWHVAVGAESWSYEWSVPRNLEHALILSRATDDSNNSEIPGDGRRVRGFGE